jgi:hypothetical protein
MPADQSGWFDDEQSVVSLEKASKLGKYKAIRSSGCLGFLLTSLKQGQLLSQEQILSGQRCSTAEESAEKSETVGNGNLQGRDSFYNLLADVLHAAIVSQAIRLISQPHTIFADHS